MEKQNTKPLVSIAMPVYNHELYIVKAIESALMQKTNFEFEIIIGDDCSTDKTHEILQSFKEKYPDKIKLILAENNQGALNNSYNIYKNCSGKYIAMMEGDDYWIYEYKLQKQIDFLEQNIEYYGCFHDALIISDFGDDITKKNQYHNEFKYYSQFNKYLSDFYSWNIIERNIIPTASFVFRNNDKIEIFFKKFADINLSLIWVFQIFIVGDGKLRYFNEVWSAYNDHLKGISKTKSQNIFKRSNIKVLKRYAKEKHFKYMRNSIYKIITNEYLQMLYNPQKKGENDAGFLRIFFLYIFSYIKTLWFELINIIGYKIHLNKN